MKVVIIGGGIAGVTMGALLLRKHHEVVINERHTGIPTGGNSFLVHHDGVDIIKELKKINRRNFMPVPGKTINTFCLKKPSGRKVIHVKMPSWQCIKRAEFINFLYALVPKEIIKEGRTFSNFIYKDGVVVAVQFRNGDVEYGDLFIGADGGNSDVRQQLFGATQYTPIEVKEVVGVAANASISQQYAGVFTKIQSNVRGIAFGFIPTSDTELVWFLQYDPTIADIVKNTPEEIKKFCLELLARFPQIAKDVVESDDFSNTYIWNTRDFDLLPSFHKGNVVLIGDAAHLALPFTSAGTTNAVKDATVLAGLLERSADFDEAFTEYYRERAEDIAAQVAMGRKLKKDFLNPKNVNEDDIQTPLFFKGNKNLHGNIKKNRKIELMYFSDPICSTCWTIQPQLRKLLLEYGQYLHVDMKMGGLLPSWGEYTSKSINRPVDAAVSWEEASDKHEIPMKGDVWINDPLNSSYPPSIAFKAAQMQNPELAIAFLRHLREQLFIRHKNIAKWSVIADSAFSCGLDIARLQRDFEGFAVVHFKQDLELCKKLEVKSFPTLIFTDQHKNVRIVGNQPYSVFVDALHQFLPGVQKKEYSKHPEEIFSNFNTLSTKEFSFIAECDYEEAINILNDLYIKEVIDKNVTSNGPLWISKTDDQLSCSVH